MNKNAVSWLRKFLFRPVIQIVKFCLRVFTSPAAASLRAALADPKGAQERLFRELLAEHEHTDYGKSHGIRSDMSWEDAMARLPLARYGDPGFDSWIEKQRKEPQKSILCSGGVLRFQRTSGSSGRSKLIPYNTALLKSFERSFCIWMYDLLTHGPRLSSLRTFMSISPGVRTCEDVEQDTGFTNDSEYLSTALRLTVRAFLSVPTDITRVEDANGFLDQLAAHLARDRELEVISVWHPSFFEIVWNHLLFNRRRIGTLLKNGDGVPKDSETADILLSDEPLEPNTFWPGVKLVSAWSDGYSEGPARVLAERFPKATFQGKGLLATEAPLTVPLVGIGNVPFLTDVLFEFHTDDGRIRRAHEVESGELYTLVIWQRGGLLRYAIGDQVRVCSVLPSGTPVLAFAGRAGDTCDLVGEKLTGAFISRHLPAYTARFADAACALAPEPESSRYILFYDASDEENSARALWWDEALRSGYHYGYARAIGQLGPIRALRVSQLAERLVRIQSQIRVVKAGDIKATPLLRDPAIIRRLLEECHT